MACGAVEDLFDGDDVGVFCGFLDEAEDGFEGFVGVVEEDVAGGDGFEHGCAWGDGGGIAGGPFGIAEVIEAGEEGEFHEGCEAGWAIDADDFLGACGGDGLDDFGEVAGGVFAEFEADGVCEAACGEDVFHFTGEVDGVFFLDGDVAISGDAEGGGGGDGFAGEKAVGVGGDEVFDEHEGDAAAFEVDGDAAADGFGDGDEGEAW